MVKRSRRTTRGTKSHTAFVLFLTIYETPAFPAKSYDAANAPERFPVVGFRRAMTLQARVVKKFAVAIRAAFSNRVVLFARGYRVTTRTSI